MTSTALLWLTCAFTGPLAAGAIPSITVDTGVRVSLIDRVQVPASVAGVLTVLDAKEGKAVKAGEIIGRVDDRAARIEADKATMEQRIAAEQATNDVNKRYAEKAHQVASADLARAEAAIKKYEKAFSETEVEHRRLTAERAKLEIEQAGREIRIAEMTAELKKTEIAAAQHEIAQRQIMAPISGVIVQLHKREGEWVNPGDQVVRILNLERLRVEFSLKPQQYTPELNGSPVRLTFERQGRQEQFSGRIVFVNPEIEPVNGKFQVWAEVENRDNLLLPGQPDCTLTILLPDAQAQR